MNERVLVFPSNTRYPKTVLIEIEPDCRSGSFSTVSKARTVPEGRIVALKRSRGRITSPPAYAHPMPSYAPDVLYEGDGDDSVIIEEWIDGETIDRKLNESESDTELFAEILGQVIEIAQDLVRTQRIYHADLTPRNILLQKQGSENIVNLIDFDPWYPVDEAGVVTANCISGSMPFIPFEHLMGELIFSGEKGSVYCIGAIFYFLLSGYPPYCEQFREEHTSRLMFGPGDMPQEKAASVQREDYLLFREWVRSRELETKKLSLTPIGRIILLMLERRPARRPGFIDVLRELESIKS